MSIVMKQMKFTTAHHLNATAASSTAITIPNAIAAINTQPNPTAASGFRLRHGPYSVSRYVTSSHTSNPPPTAQTHHP